MVFKLLGEKLQVEDTVWSWIFNKVEDTVWSLMVTDGSEEGLKLHVCSSGSPGGSSQPYLFYFFSNKDKSDQSIDLPTDRPINLLSTFPPWHDKPKTFQGINKLLLNNPLFRLTDLSSWQDKSSSQKGWDSKDRSVVAALPWTSPRLVHKSSTDDLRQSLYLVNSPENAVAFAANGKISLGVGWSELLQYPSPRKR